MVQHKIVLVACKDFGFVLDSLHGMVDGNLSGLINHELIKFNITKHGSFLLVYYIVIKL